MLESLSAEIRSGHAGDTLHPSTSPPLVVRRAVLEVMKTGVLSLSLTGCSTLESGSYISPGQHSGADPDSEDKSVKAGKLSSSVLRRVGPVHLLGSTIELALDVWPKVSRALEQDS